MANPTAITLHALEAEASSDVSDAVDIGEDRSALSLVLIAAAVASGELLVQVETSPDGSTGWRIVGQFTSSPTAAARVKSYFADCDQYVRVRWTITGDCTFRVTGTAYTVYCDQDDLLGSLTQDVFDQVPEWVRIKALIDASSKVEGLVYTAHDVPLTAWEASLSKAAEQFAAGYVQTHHRLHGGGVDEAVERGVEQAEAWMLKIQKAEVKQPHTEPADDLGPRALSGDPDNPTEYRELFSESLGTSDSDF